MNLTRFRRIHRNIRIATAMSVSCATAAFAAAGGPGAQGGTCCPERTRRTGENRTASATSPACTSSHEFVGVEHRPVVTPGK